MPFMQDIENCHSHYIGPSGLSDRELRDSVSGIRAALERLRAEIAEGLHPALTLVHDDVLLQQLTIEAKRIVAGAKDIVLFGIGGSALAPHAMRELARRKNCGREPVPKLHIFDNPETPWMERFISSLDVEGLRFLVISKSGASVETLMQCLWAIDYLQVRGLGHTIPQRMLVVTTPAAGNPLFKLATDYGIPILPHPPDVGGRYSVFSTVGMLPALLLGLDVKRMRKAAAALLAHATSAPAGMKLSFLQGAAVQYALIRKRQLNAVILMPYTTHMSHFTSWWRQLWAESLGKNGLGPLPVGATGPLDQHSQLQLYLDGPNDKLFTLVMLRTRGMGYRAPRALAAEEDEKIACLAGATLGDMTECAQNATLNSLVERGRPVRCIRMEEVNETTLGALFMHFMLETILLGYALGIDPFDQPAVERSKSLTRECLKAAGTRPMSP